MRDGGAVRGVVGKEEIEMMGAETERRKEQ